MDDYQMVKGCGVSVEHVKQTVSLKGHLNELDALYTAIKNGRPHWPIPLWDIFQTTKASLIT